MRAYLKLIETLSMKPDAARLQSLGRRQEHTLVETVAAFVKALPRHIVRDVVKDLSLDKPTERSPLMDQAERDVDQACPNLSPRVKAIVSRRLAILRQRGDNHDYYHADVSRLTISRWSAMYRGLGIPGLVPGKSTGRPRKTEETSIGA